MMNPDATLALIRELARDVDASCGRIPDEARALAERIGDLDEWLTRGGYFPLAWDWLKEREPKDAEVIASEDDEPIS